MTLKLSVCVVCVFCCTGLGACAAGPDYDGAVLYHAYTRLDPDTRTETPNAWLVIEGRRIVATGEGQAPQADYAETYDMSGTYALPGLIDGHAHITSGYHKVAVIDGAPQISIEIDDEITQYHRRATLAFGVTTVRNPGSDPEASARYDEKVASGEWLGPDALHAGAVIQPSPFTGASFAHPTSAEEWDREAARQADLGMTYFKLYTSLSEDEIAQGVVAAEAHGLVPIAHLDRVSWTKAAELGVDILEHALPTSPDLIEPAHRAAYLDGYGLSSKSAYKWFELVEFEGPLFNEMVETLKEEEVALNLTLTVNCLIYQTDDLKKVMTEDVQRYVHPKAFAATTQFLMASAYGWTEEDYARARAVWPKVTAFTRHLHEAGIPMMIGTDGSGSGPLLAHEMALHVDAGIDPWDVLHMATGGAAEIMGLGDETGRLAAGYEADIVFLKADPLEDMRAVKEVSVVVNNGTHLDAEALRATF